MFPKLKLVIYKPLVVFVVIHKIWINCNLFSLTLGDKSVIVFSDVYEGQQICMMTGTKENIQTKISAVASNVLRSTG